METKKYISPSAEIMEFLSEAVLCSSNEPVKENDGNW